MSNDSSTSPEDPANSTVIDAGPAKRVSGGTAETRTDRARRSGYRSRFALIYVALAVVAGIGIGALIVLISRPDAPEAAKWSAWEPEGSSDARALQIADRISGRYRLPTGDQLAIALVGPPAVSAGSDIGDIPVRAIAVRPDTSQGLAEEDDIEVIDAKNNLMYVLCGLGEGCSIASGQPSSERHELLRREALELSLYSFKHVPDVSSVTVFLPPSPDGASATSVFFRRGDVQPMLDKPLARTLGAKVPPLGKFPLAEATSVNNSTLTRLYDYEYTQAQDGSAILVLSPTALGA
jgi:hypothetical protein